MYGAFSACDSFQQVHSSLQGFKSGNIHQVRLGNSVLGDEDRDLVLYHLREDARSFPLEGCNEVSFHKSDTKVSLRNKQAQAPAGLNLSAIQFVYNG